MLLLPRVARLKVKWKAQGLFVVLMIFFHAALLIVGHDVEHPERLIVAVIKFEEREYTMSEV